MRPEHAALHGVTLPASDSFWDTYFPPNGWNCRCTVVQVLRDKYPETDHNEAMRLGREAMTKDTKGMFSFNPGKEGRVFPAYNPYTIYRCATCDKAKLNLAAGIPNNQLCQACPFIMSMVNKERITKLSSKDVKKIRQAANDWAEKHLPEVILGNGQTAKRLVINNGNNGLIVNKPFFSETFTKNIRSAKLAKTMEIATRIDEWLPSATIVRTEIGKHHPYNFIVYEAPFDGEIVECKVKDLAEKYVYTMKIK